MYHNVFKICSLVACVAMSCSTKALGLLKGTLATGANKGQCDYFIYMTMDYLPTGWSVLYAK